MKLAGVCAIALCCWMVGMYLASGLSRQVATIEGCIALMGTLFDRLRYLQPPMHSLISGVAELEQFSGLSFLKDCDSRMKRGERFPDAWRESMKAAEKSLGEDVAPVLLPLGEVLGSTDLDSQLTALAHARRLLESRLEHARGYREKHAGLYRSLGLLLGIALAIILL